ncbi:hypothetical protein F8388_000624 [Cannabis sativa]|uniref:Protein AAR2 homolog n=1 Tax=Cannabis sativa TaxID=3483 RepID=A0A7J6GI14_CANSA|nr:hypothetical protein F8388_000624 [Cannabis sativa]
MDPEVALELVKHGATFFLLDVPQYTLVGIDTQVFTVGPSFKGIKMIPSGPHFVFYSSSTRDGKEFSPIIGFFKYVDPSEIIVRKWDQQEERLIKVLEEEEERFCEAVRRLEFDRHLGPYNLSQYATWKSLSNYITKNIIERIEPIGGEITVASEPAMMKNTPKTTVEKALDEQLKDSKCSISAENSQQTGCYYTSIPRIIKQKGIQGQELTALNLDKTHLLESLLVKEYGGSGDLLLGELQFAFIAFVMGQSLEAFLQWKSIVSLLFGCTEAVRICFCIFPTTFPYKESALCEGFVRGIAICRSQFMTLVLTIPIDLYQQFIKVIYYQLKYGLQKDNADSSGAVVGASALIDDSWFSADSFLHHLCKDFFSLIQEASVVDGDLLSWTRRLKELLENNLGWQFQQNSAVDGIYFEEDDEVGQKLYYLNLVAKHSSVTPLNLAQNLYY